MKRQVAALHKTIVIKSWELLPSVHTLVRHLDKTNKQLSKIPEDGRGVGAPKYRNRCALTLQKAGRF